MAAKRDPELDAEAQSWIEAVIDEPFPNDVLYEDALKDGVILCKYVFFFVLFSSVRIVIMSVVYNQD